MKKKKTAKMIFARREKVTQRLISASTESVDKVLLNFNSAYTGLKNDQIDEIRDLYGQNVITTGKGKSIFKKIFDAFFNPFQTILIILGIVSVITDVILSKPDEQDFITFVVIFTMILVSGFLRLQQEAKSNKASEKLTEMVQTTTRVERERQKEEVPLDEVVVGDIIHLAAGDIIPADIRIIRAKDLFISQSALTGESEVVEKFSNLDNNNYDAILERPNLAFMGTTVISGAAQGIVVAVGNDTFFGQIAQSVTTVEEKTSFEKGVSSVSWVLIKFMLVMVPIVLFINGFTKGNWMQSLLFAVSIAVGLTPEMLPMIITTSLAKGAVAMSKKKTIIKNLNSIQDFGSMDILCTDKTGTLTQDKVVLEYHLDVHGNENPRILRHAFLNSYFQTGLKNLLDKSIIEKTIEYSADYDSLKGLAIKYEKVDEVPFDFSRRRMSIVVQDKNEKTQMITKGAVEEILSICSFVEFQGKVEPLTKELKEEVLKTVDHLNDQGMRVIAVAQKTNPSPIGEFSVADEANMVLMGYLAFLDPPKDSTAEAIQLLATYGVETKVLTGDNDRVTRAICKKVGIKVDNLLLGSDIEQMSDEQLAEVVEKTNVFAKLSPDQKARIVRALKNNGHVVGFMGDGINDAPAMKASDVGISVDTAVDIAKESAHVILLEKDLNVLGDGIIEGRKTYANMIKYIKMTASSNFGNMFSVLIASAFLPFLPMMPVHLILLNLIYDISCIAIPWDNVDLEYLKEPRKWDASDLGKFMIWLGPSSSIFDVVTYALMFYIIGPKVLGSSYHLLDAEGKLAFMMLFQAGWFVESMWTQTLVIHMIRTKKIPFIQSRASLPVTLLTFTGIGVLTLIPFTSFGNKIGLMPLPPIYFVYLTIIVVLYMALATIIKKLYVKKYKELL